MTYEMKLAIQAIKHNMCFVLRDHVDSFELLGLVERLITIETGTSIKQLKSDCADLFYHLVRDGKTQIAYDMDHIVSEFFEVCEHERKI